MSENIQILLALLIYAAALGMFLLEIFVPGGIVGVIGLLLLGWSLYWLYEIGQAPLATTLLVLTGLYLVIMFRFSVRRLSHQTNLGPSDSSGDDVRAAAASIGAEGVTLTDLRPAGMARIGGRRLDVVTGGAFLEAGTVVVVSEVSGNRVVVRRAPGEPAQAPATEPPPPDVSPGA